MHYKNDDNLIVFEKEGALQLPKAVYEGFTENENAKIWYATYGEGRPVVLLHGGLGNSNNWGYQVEALIQNGYMPVVLDTRGHGKSTWDTQPYSYQLMARDVKAVVDALRLDSVAVVGWSDGAVTAIVLADLFPETVSGIVYFACNMDESGVLEEIDYTSVVAACFNRHKIDYARLSETPEAFDTLVEALTVMQKSQPNYSDHDLKRISVPVLILHSENDEFIKREHSTYLADTIPKARFELLEGVSHFAPLQRPNVFNKALLQFLKSINY